MIPIPANVRIWIAVGHTDMRRGMRGLALQVQESLKRDPHQGDLYLFRGRNVAMEAPQPFEYQALREAQARVAEAEAELARVRAINSDLIARNAHLELQNEKMRRAMHGPSSERTRRLIDQMELEFEELEATATQDEIAAQLAAARATTVESFTRKRGARRDFPAGLPVERIVVPAADACPCCGSDDLSKLGETVTRTLETVPARHKILETVRERFSCRSCQTITQPPAPFHVTPRGMFGPHFLATLAFNKFGLHQPLNSQRDRLASQGIPLSLSTLADQIGAIAAATAPIFLLIEAHALGAAWAASRQECPDATWLEIRARRSLE